MNTRRNPFSQPTAYYLLRFEVPRRAVEAVEDAFHDIALAVSSFEIAEDSELWRVEILCAVVPAPKELVRRVEEAALWSSCAIKPPRTEILPAQDWVSAVKHQFPVFRVGRYLVHGSHHAPPVPSGLIPLQIDAGLAFGTGEHATTYTCLLALDRLARQRDFAWPLDMGCGSGILAIAIAKTWGVAVDAVDIDPVAVRVARQNAAINRVSRQVRCFTADGYRARDIRRAGVYDLIVSNILARPLVAFAPLLARHLAPGGMAILSGLLGTQERQVLSAHRAQGLYLHQRIAKDGWHTLVLSND